MFEITLILIVGLTAAAVSYTLAKILDVEDKIIVIQTMYAELYETKINFNSYESVTAETIKLLKTRVEKLENDRTTEKEPTESATRSKNPGKQRGKKS